MIRIVGCRQNTCETGRDDGVVQFRKFEEICKKNKARRHAINYDDDEAITEINLTHAAEKCKNMFEDIQTIVSNRKDLSHSSSTSAEIVVPTTSSPSSSSRPTVPLLTVEKHQALLRENQDQKSQIRQMEEKEKRLKAQPEQARAPLGQSKKKVNLPRRCVTSVQGWITSIQDARAATKFSKPVLDIDASKAGPQVAGKERKGKASACAIPVEKSERTNSKTRNSVVESVGRLNRHCAILRVLVT